MFLQPQSEENTVQAQRDVDTDKYALSRSMQGKKWFMDITQYLNIDNSRKLENCRDLCARIRAEVEAPSSVMGDVPQMEEATEAGCMSPRSKKRRCETRCYMCHEILDDTTDVCTNCGLVVQTIELDDRNTSTWSTSKLYYETNTVNIRFSTIKQKLKETCEFCEIPLTYLIQSNGMIEQMIPNADFMDQILKENTAIICFSILLAVIF